MTNNSLFAALYRGYYEAANDNSRVALLEYFVPVIDRWNIQWGDGTLDPLDIEPFLLLIDGDAARLWQTSILTFSRVLTLSWNGPMVVSIIYIGWKTMIP